MTQEAPHKKIFKNKTKDTNKLIAIHLMNKAYLIFPVNYGLVTKTLQVFIFQTKTCKLSSQTYEIMNKMANPIDSFRLKDSILF
ncbi:MAG: hypothetical protein KDF59_03450 [Nitrosomonas sp.]|nr:hypothetical protein [Nitrosomonas sp.]